MPILEDYLRSDRQWLRENRLIHAKYELSRATDSATIEFWHKVIKANEYD